MSLIELKLGADGVWCLSLTCAPRSSLRLEPGADGVLQLELGPSPTPKCHLGTPRRHFELVGSRESYASMPSAKVYARDHTEYHVMRFTMVDSSGGVSTCNVATGFNVYWARAVSCRIKHIRPSPAAQPGCTRVLGEFAFSGVTDTARSTGGAMTDPTREIHFKLPFSFDCDTWEELDVVQCVVAPVDIGMCHKPRALPSALHCSPIKWNEPFVPTACFDPTSFFGNE